MVTGGGRPPATETPATETPATETSSCVERLLERSRREKTKRDFESVVIQIRLLYPLFETTKNLETKLQKVNQKYFKSV